MCAWVFVWWSEMDRNPSLCQRDEDTRGKDNHQAPPLMTARMFCLCLCTCWVQVCLCVCRTGGRHLENTYCAWLGEKISYYQATVTRCNTLVMLGPFQWAWTQHVTLELRLEDNGLWCFIQLRSHRNAAIEFAYKRKRKMHNVAAIRLSYAFFIMPFS